MSDRSEQGVTEKKKRVWIEPEIEQLDLSETAAHEGQGSDGETFADCSKS